MFTFFTQSKVCDFHITVCVEQQVVQLEVSREERKCEDVRRDQSWFQCHTKHIRKTEKKSQRNNHVQSCLQVFWLTCCDVVYCQHLYELLRL